MIGKNEERPEPTKSELRNMYDSQLPPYYVDGPDSANVNMSSAIALLCRYCQSLPCDGYTTHAPDWYVEESVTKQFRVHILMPTCCPLVDSIQVCKVQLFIIRDYLQENKLELLLFYTTISALTLLRNCYQFIYLFKTMISNVKLIFIK